MSHEDPLHAELKSLKHTISLCNPAFQAYENDWKTGASANTEVNTRENNLTKTLASFNAAPIAKDKEIQSLLESMDSDGAPEKLSTPTKAIEKNEIPMAKRSHMNGILHGLPGNAMPKTSTARDSHIQCDRMKTMIVSKNTDFFRKRDKYSEYVEARARFSKMHSVK